MTYKYKFSLIVPTRNRNKDLFLLLRSLENQQFKDFEVIIVDQNLEDEINSCLCNYSLDIQIIKSLPISASNARNLGSQYAKGEILTFPDDDSWYSPLILNNVENIFRLHKVDIICGNTIDPTCNKSNTRFLNKTKFITNKEAPKAGIEFSIFIFNHVFFSLGKFDEKISPGSTGIYQAGEATDLLIRGIRERYKIFYDKNITIYHPYKSFDKGDLNSIKKQLRKEYSYAAGFGYVMRKNNQNYYFLYYLIRSILKLIFHLALFDRVEAKMMLQVVKGRLYGYRTYKADATR